MRLFCVQRISRFIDIKGQLVGAISLEIANEAPAPRPRKDFADVVEFRWLEIPIMLAESEELHLDFVELKATDSGYSLYKSLGFEDVISKYHNMKYMIDDRNKI